jgi:hypothetical protein
MLELLLWLLNIAKEPTYHLHGDEPPPPPKP